AWVPPRVLAVAALAAIATLSGAASAQQQSAPPDSQNFDLMLFEPALGTHSFLTVVGAETMSKNQFQVQIGIGYMTHPLSVYVVDPSQETLKTTRADVVDSMFVGHLGVAFGLLRSLQLGVVVPAILSESGQGLDPSTGMPQVGGLSVS